MHEENTKENHNRVVPVYVIQTHVTLSWNSLQILLNIFGLRIHKLPIFRKEWPVPLIRSAEYNYQNTLRIFHFHANIEFPKRSNGKRTAPINITNKDFERDSGSCIQRMY